VIARFGATSRVKVFFDTSVLLPCFFEDHIHHELSLRILQSVNKPDVEGCCGAHTLAELYSRATRLPVKTRPNPEQVLLFIDDIRERLQIVSLTSDEYADALKEGARIGIVGGAIYDLLLASCALKAGADWIYSWNLRHFERFSPEVAGRLKTP
jgi:predicted nucleic acid-binding protein